jgi:FtsP/CotA-like multicopper oxidase with cupredoxin domain
VVLWILLGGIAHAQSSNDVCPRPADGATISSPPELRSDRGVLELSLHLKYQQTLVGEGPPRYCYITDDGLESPTLRVYPGDKLIIHLHNDLPPWRDYRTQAHQMKPVSQDEDCAATGMDPSFTNLHFHGMSIPPVCHQDDVIRTAIPAGQEFDYRVTIPQDEPPGLYWYHPHPHGYGERQVQGGASGALIVEGLEDIVPFVRTLPERMIVLRDQQRTDPSPNGPSVPAWDISANFVPVTFSKGQPAILKTKPSEKELWRVVNAGADTIFDIQVLIHEEAQALQVLAVDGVPVAVAKPMPSQTSILLPPGARAEFVVITPGEGDTGQLITKAWDTGPQGDNDTKRTIADIVSATSPDRKSNAAAPPPARPWSSPKSPTAATVHRHLYFSQQSANPQDPDNFVLYYVTVVGQAPKTYKMGAPPNVVVHRGDIEDWTIENRSPEDHVFHIHQIHFQVLEVDGKPVNDSTMRDTVNVPYWNGDGPYPSVKLRMDFRDPDIVGNFLYHCHILKHEDMGMVGAIEVLPPGTASTATVSTPRSKLKTGDPVVILMKVIPEHATGNVQFAIDGREVGKPVAVSGGQATFTTSFGEPGRHAISAVYFGDSVYDESAARPLEIRVRE